METINWTNFIYLICRTVVTVTSSVVEVPAAETSVIFSPYNTHTSITGTTITFEASVQTVITDASTAFVATVNGETVTLDLPFTTTWTFSSTSLELSFAARTSAFIFTGDSSVEVTIPAEHTHVTVGGVETAIDLSGITTTLTVTGSTNVILTMPEVITIMEIPKVTTEFIVTTDTISTSDGSTYCASQSIGEGNENSPCVVGTTFTITLPTSADNLYLHADGLTTAIDLPGITTTFKPWKQFYMLLEVFSVISFEDKNTLPSSL